MVVLSWESGAGEIADSIFSCHFFTRLCSFSTRMLRGTRKYIFWSRVPRTISICDTRTRSMSYVTLLSADGAWRWSPPGRLKVVVPTCKAADVRATAVRAARLGAASSWVLSLDGTLPIDLQSTIACGSAVHLLSACGDGVSTHPEA